MKLKNSTEWTDRFLRRMVSFCSRIVGFKVGSIREANFRNRRFDFSGHAWGGRYGGRICVSVARTNDSFPSHCRSYGGTTPVVFEDRLEALIGVTAHEIAHLAQYRDKRKKLAEHDADWHAKQVLKKFRENRAELIYKWCVTPTPTDCKPGVTLQETRYANTLQKISEWERKEKLAKTKLKAWRRKARYYEKAIAAKKSA